MKSQPRQESRPLLNKLSFSYKIAETKTHKKTITPLFEARLLFFIMILIV